MLQRLLTHDAARGILEQFSEAAGLDLLELGTTASAETINNTAVAQPLIVATSLLSWKLSETLNEQIGIVAGHSVGAITAYALAGAYDAETAVRLAAARGSWFREATETQTPSGMSALLGPNAWQQFQENTWANQAGIKIAVVNSESQIVVAGPLTALKELPNQVPARSRVIPLPVSGAFHTSSMLPAVAKLAQLLETVAISDPKKPVISDLTGQTASGGQYGNGTAADAIGHLTTQITQPVRWDLVTQTLTHLLPDAVASEQVELAPAGTLTALLKRTLPSITTNAW
jgi:[acyl-carrier-protein] S-malonyltransferase